MNDFREEFGFIPPELLYKCHQLVKAFHAQRGSNKEFVAASVMYSAESPYLINVVKKAIILWKISRFVGLLALITIAITVLVSWWFLAAAVPVALAAIAVYKRGEAQLVQQRAIILAVEMLTIDFAGWGKFFHTAHLKAVIWASGHRPKLVGLYLPPERRTADIAELFAPSEGSKA